MFDLGADVLIINLHIQGDDWKGFFVFDQSIKKNAIFQWVRTLKLEYQIWQKI